MRYLIAIITMFISVSISYGQDAVTGKIENYTHGSGQIVTGIKGPIVIGTVDKDGMIEIPLDASYKEKMIAAIEESNASSSDWKTSLPNLERAYGSCANGEISIEGGEQMMITLSTMGMFMAGNLEENEPYGKFMFASDPEFADTFLAFGKFKENTGYQLDWVYFEEAASVKGSCILESYTMNSEKYNFESEYDLEFKAGWNIVKYEIVEIFTDKDGKQYRQKERSTVIDTMPDDVQIIFSE